jgi:plasmid stabilization system protein ParE
LRLVWTGQAFERLAAIEEPVAADDPAAAAALVDRLVLRTETLREFPRLGRRLPEGLRDDLRELIEAGYRIVYRHADDVVEILTVFEGHRLLRPEELGDSSDSSEDPRERR